MPGMKERTHAAAQAFKDTIGWCAEGWKVQAKAVTTIFSDKQDDIIGPVTGAILTVGIPIFILPMAAGEALRGFIKPAEVNQSIIPKP